MNTSLVMTVIGQDRPGLVRSVASMVAKHKGNWLESRMCRLGGQFAGILRVEVPGESELELIRALKTLETQGLTIVVLTDRQKSGAVEKKLMYLELVGQDRPGIVNQISNALASQGVNLEELHTECASAAMSGETHFKAQAKLDVPDSCDLAALRKDLEKIAADLIVDISFEPMP